MGIEFSATQFANRQCQGQLPGPCNVKKEHQKSKASPEAAECSHQMSCGPLLSSVGTKFPFDVLAQAHMQHSQIALALIADDGGDNFIHSD